MATTILPSRVGADLDALHIRRPFLRDEAVVDVKRALLFPPAVLESVAQIDGSVVDVVILCCDEPNTSLSLFHQDHHIRRPVEAEFYARQCSTLTAWQVLAADGVFAAHSLSVGLAKLVAGVGSWARVDDLLTEHSRVGNLGSLLTRSLDAPYAISVDDRHLGPLSPTLVHLIGCSDPHPALTLAPA